ncbi:MAG: hypothetical protein RBG13Loki_2134 [Promethearchaeota archaeon CR_4]|nr:MAG: hypothetical protein RBG13Loki_2134 [Candidatus Lokiarchaeota archaeon CR_4]
MEFTAYVSLLIAILFGIMLVLFAYQTSRKKSRVPQLLASLFFGCMGGILAFIDSGELMASGSRSTILAFQLSCYSMQFFFFYLFLEHLNFMKLSPIRLGIVLSFMSLQYFSLWTIVWFDNFNEVTTNLWLLADLGYNNLALFVFLVMGLPIYLKAYQETRERKPIIFSIALALVGAGFVVISLNDYLSYLHAVPDWLFSIQVLGDILPMTGLLLFLLVYVSDIDYIYRFPNNNYILFVANKTGSMMHAVRFKTRRPLRIQPELLSGVLSAINSVFKSGLEVTADITSIASKNLTILLESGKFVTAAIVADKTPAILAKALKRYVTEFESKFVDQIRAETGDTSVFNSALDLLKPIFPFFVVESEKLV